MQIPGLQNNFEINWRHLAAAICIVSGVYALITVAQTGSSLSAKTAIQDQDMSATNSSQTITPADQTATANQSTGQATTSQPTSSPAQSTTSQTKLDSGSSTQNQTKNPFSTTTDPQELFANLSLSAEAVMVWNQADNKVIYQKNAQKEQPLASITKLMTALVATESANSSTTAVINQQHLQATGEYGLKAGEPWSLDELITFMLVHSSNDAARAVAGAVTKNPDDGYASEFVDMMNETANRLGLDDTYFFNPSGLDINEELISGGYGTALDTVRLFDYITTNHPQLLQPTTEPEVSKEALSGQMYTVENTNEDIGQYNDVYGSKTGYTVLAGGNLVMGFQLQEPVVIALFDSTKSGRFADMQQLHQAAKRFFEITN